MARVRITLTIAATLDLEVEQLDVVTAFLGSELEEEVYLRFPDGILGGPRIMRLRKSLYGLKQSPRCWYITMDSFIMSALGFTRCRYDTCIYIRHDGTTIVLYVDDMLLIGKAEAVTEARDRIAGRFDVVCLGPVKHFLGMVIEQDRAERHIFLSQAGYSFISKVLETRETLGAKAWNAARTPYGRPDPNRRSSAQTTTTTEILVPVPASINLAINLCVFKQCTRFYIL